MMISNLEMMISNLEMMISNLEMMISNLEISFLPSFFIFACMKIKKKFFGHFTLTPSHIAMKRHVYRGFRW